MTCESCSSMVGYDETSWGKHHHVNCPKYDTEKFPYLFYYEEAENAWCPAPDNLCDVIELDAYSDGEKVDIEFKRVDFTDKELAELPEE